MEATTPLEQSMQPASSARGLKFVSLLIFAAVLSAMTVVFGVAPLRVVRAEFGRAAFAAGSLALVGLMLAAGLYPYAVIMFALIVLTGVYAEIEEHGGSVFTSGAVAVLASLGASALATGLWLHHSKINMMNEARAQMAPLVERLSSISANPSATMDGGMINVDTLVQQLPSGVAITLVMSLAIALLWDRRLIRWWNIRSERLTPQALGTFRVPDAFVWLVMVAILGSFLHHGISWLEVVSMNALNVFVVLYFFQGLAVVAHAFRRFKVTPFWQSLWYVLIVLQLFLLVSLIGFADFWLDFRERLVEKPVTTGFGK